MISLRVVCLFAFLAFFLFGASLSEAGTPGTLIAVCADNPAPPTGSPAASCTDLRLVYSSDVPFSFPEFTTEDVRSLAAPIIFIFALVWCFVVLKRLIVNNR